MNLFTRVSSTFISIFLLSSQVTVCFDPMDAMRAHSPVKAYLYETGNEMLMTGMTEGPQKVLPRFADRTVTRLANKTAHKVLRAKTPYQKDLVSWFLGSTRQGVMSKMQMGNKAPSGWLSSFVLYGLVPSFTKHIITNLAYFSVVNKLNLDYPDKLKKWPFFYLLIASTVTMIGRTAVDTGYHWLLDYFQNKPSEDLQANSLAPVQQAH